MYVKATMTNGTAITDKTPVYEWDTTTTAGTTYIRYESTNGVDIYIERISATKQEKTYDAWGDRVTATYVPMNSI